MSVPNILVYHDAVAIIEREAWDRGLRPRLDGDRSLRRNGDGLGSPVQICDRFLFQWPVCSYWFAGWYVWVVVYAWLWNGMMIT
jgi:hypothetical protein